MRILCSLHNFTINNNWILYITRQHIAKPEWNIGFHKMGGGISWPAANWLASQEGLCSVEWVSNYNYLLWKKLQSHRLSSRYLVFPLSVSIQNSDLPNSCANTTLIRRKGDRSIRKGETKQCFFRYLGRFCHII